jgi:protein TonB
VTKPEKIAGDIRSAGDYPVPPGGREARFGQAVTIAMTVGVDGRASNCRVVQPSSDPVADRITCQLAVDRFRFRPATDAKGDPVAATYGWRQTFFRAR